MKDKIKYLIHKLFIYDEVDTKDPLIISCITNLLLISYPDFKKQEIIKIISSVYDIYFYDINSSLTLTGYSPSLIIESSDYNELYLSLYEIKKSLT